MGTESIVDHPAFADCGGQGATCRVCALRDCPRGDLRHYQDEDDNGCPSCNGAHVYLAADGESGTLRPNGEPVGILMPITNTCPVHAPGIIANEPGSAVSYDGGETWRLVTA